MKIKPIQAILLACVAQASATTLVTYNFDDPGAVGVDSTYGLAQLGKWYDSGVAYNTNSSPYSTTLVSSPIGNATIGDGAALTVYSSIGLQENTLDTADGIYFRIGMKIQNLADGETIDLNTLTFDMGGYGAQTGHGFGVYSDDYSATYIDSLASGITFDNSASSSQSVDLSSITGLQNDDIVFFRMHFSKGASSSTARAMVFDNFVFDGTVNTVTVPEPTAATLLGLGGLALMARRKR